ncbi:MAG: hypothetical protein FJ304_19160, partial [Planctomycetes bacterium]|nr:hypothetical protein [Planctomycetota bacterium]
NRGQEVVQDRPRPGRRQRAVRRFQDDQPELRGDRPDQAPRGSGLRRVPGRRRARIAHHVCRSAPDRAGQVRQGTARPLHGRRRSGQGVPEGPLRQREGLADEARRPARLHRSGRRLGPVQEGLRAEARRHARRGQANTSDFAALALARDATPEEGRRLIAFAKMVDKADDATFRKDIESHLDVDNYLRFMAATAFLANTDSFFDIGHNYYLHLNPKTNKVQFLPWDLDRAFANFGNAARNMDLSLIHPYGGTHKLTERLLAAPGVAERYQKLFKELAGTAFAKDRLLKELAAVEKATADARAADAKAAMARKEVTGPSFFGVPPELSAFVQTRTDSITAQLEGKSKGFIPQRFGFGPKK